MTWLDGIGLQLLRQQSSAVNRLSALGRTLASWPNRLQATILSVFLARPADHGIQIEDHPPGYPRFAALIASHDSFYVYRRFSLLRARLLLLKQDKLSQLELRLQKVDQEETQPLYLGSSRRDDNPERQLILSEVDSALADYDTLIERCGRIADLEPASIRNVGNLRNWVEGNGCIARGETAYLAHAEDLASVRRPEDNVVTCLESILEEGHGYFSTRNSNSISRDPNVYISSRAFIARQARILMAPIVVMLLLAPVIVCNSLASGRARLVTIIIATALFVIALSVCTKAKTIEVTVGGATYVTVLVVFIGSSNISE